MAEYPLHIWVGGFLLGFALRHFFGVIADIFDAMEFARSARELRMSESEGDAERRRVEKAERLAEDSLREIEARR